MRGVVPAGRCPMKREPRRTTQPPSVVPNPKGPTVDELFAILEYILQRSSVRHSRAARPIVFELLPDREEVYLFDPRAPGRLFTRVERADAALRVRCQPDLLLRAMTDARFELRPEDSFSFDGDLDQLRILGESLLGARSPVSVRFGSKR